MLWSRVVEIWYFLLLQFVQSSDKMTDASKITGSKKCPYEKYYRNVFFANEILKVESADKAVLHF